MKKKIEEIRTDYVCDQNLRHIDVYFVGSEEGKTVAVIDLDTRKVIHFENDLRFDESVEEAIAEVLASTPLPSEDYTSFTKEALYDWNRGLEVSPVMEDKGKGFCEVVDDPKDAMFWSVYCHQHSGGVVCVGNFNTQKQAEEFEGFLDLLSAITLPKF